MSRSHLATTKAQAAVLDLSKLWLEAGTVIGLRLWGLAGGSRPRGETTG